MKTLLLSLLILTSVNSFCQVKTEADTLIYDIKGLQVKPEYPGGKEKMDAFIIANFKIPSELKMPKKIAVMFVIEKDGSLNNIKVLKDAGYGTAKEAIRVLKLMPKWLPGQQNGNTVRSLSAITIPVNAKK